MPNVNQPLEDDEIRQKKAAENPLVQYFSGNQPPTQPVAPAAPRAPVAKPPTATNVGSAAPPPAAPQVRPTQRAPAPGGFTNFNRIQAANRGVSDRMANTYAQSAENKARTAAESLSALKDRFGQDVSTGTVRAAQEGTNGSMSRQQDDEMRALADASYTGPGGLGDVSNVGDTYAATLAAQNELGAIGSDGGLQALVQERSGGNAGTSKLSAALLGASGRNNFDALRARFNPENELKTAEADAAKSADAARATSATNAKSWADLAAKRDAQQKAQDEKDAAKPAGPSGLHEKLRKEADAEAAWGRAMQHNTADDANSAFNDFNLAMSPITQLAEATGNADPIQKWGTSTLTPNAGAASGGTGGQKIWWKPEHRKVWDQMTPEQWAELNRLPPHGQATWLNRRAEEVKKGLPNGALSAQYGRNMFQT